MSNCSSLRHPPPLLEPNPDVSGIGVLVVFMATAFITWILPVFHYVVVYDPEMANLTHGANQHPNPIDRILLKWTFARLNRPSRNWEAGVEKLVLMLSDQQMITGIALLVSGHSQLQFSISAFHWQIIVYLVWYSSFTHLATLTVLRRYLRDNKPMRWWRLLLMFLVLAGLCVALVPTGHADWLPELYLGSDYPANLGMYAVCFFSAPLTANSQLYSVIVSMFVLIISYTTRAIKLFQWSSEKARRWLRTIPGDKLRNAMDELYVGMQSKTQHRWIMSLPYWFIFCLYIIAKAWFDLASSMLWEITWLLMALIWGTVRLFLTRSLTAPDNEGLFNRPNTGIFDENGWGFGQCLSMAMLLLILFAAVEVYYETSQRIKYAKDVSEHNFIASQSMSTSIPISVVSFGSYGKADDRTTPSNAVVEDTSGQRTSTQYPKSNDIGIPLEIVVRSSSIIDFEESTIGMNQQPILRKRVSYSGSQDTSNYRNLLTREIQEMAPHRGDLYQHRWFRILVVLIFIQVLLLSVYVLTSANGAYSILVDFSMYNPQDPVQLLQSLSTWITLYAPGNAVILVAYSLFPQATAHWRWRIRLAQWYSSKWPRPHTRAHFRAIKAFQTFLILSMMAYNAILLFEAPFLAIWEDYIFYGQYLTVHVTVLVLSIGIPWCIVLRLKLRRHATRSS